MSEHFLFDVFLSHSSKDKAIVRPIAERLQRDGLRVWFDEWEIKPGDSIPAKIEEGLEHSRVLVLCMSANAFGSDWSGLEANTFRFRDPLNKERRFIPLRLDSTPIKGSLAQFLYINWHAENHDPEYSRLLEACRPAHQEHTLHEGPVYQNLYEQALSLGHTDGIKSVVFSPDGKYALCGSHDRTIRIWEIASRRCLHILEGHTNSVRSVAWSPDENYILSGSHDRTIRIWEIASRHCLHILEGHTDSVLSVAWSPDGKYALSGSHDQTIRIWEIASRHCLHILEGHTYSVLSVAWSPDGKYILSGSDDRTIRIWEIASGRCLHILEGHTDSVLSVAWSPDGKYILSGSDDRTIRIWEIASRRCLHILEGHTYSVLSVAWSPDGKYILSGSDDRTIRIWEIASGRCLHILEGHTDSVLSVAWSTHGSKVLSAASNCVIHLWNAREMMPHSSSKAVRDLYAPPFPEQLHYTNAKVVLVGESGTGKTGLSRRLALDDWKPSDSTVGAWATHWKLPVSDDDGVAKEIWLWDFGGQADQRLIHQLYMDETALVVMVFDGQKENIFETLGQWDRDLTRAASTPFTKLLVAGRVDTGGLRVSRTQMETFGTRHGYLSFIETSAKSGLGCEELRQAILDGIRWDDIPCRTTEVLFKHLKEEIVALKEEGRVLIRFNELRETLQLRLSSKHSHFTDDELRAVLTLLAGPGVVWELKFGSWVLLQPERINAYAQAVIQTLRQDKFERGCLMEEQVLTGNLVYESSMTRLEGEEERFILLAMHQTLVERGLCFREPTEKGVLLVFPSYYRRERPALGGHPAVLVSYRFNGFLDDIYATLVVRLHHTQPFQQDQLWRYAADFKTLSGKQLGIELVRRTDGTGELDVYFDPTISIEEKIIFSKYVHEHLRQNAREVVRLRHYVCPHCGTPIGNQEVAMRKLNEGKKDLPCVNCDDFAKRVPLWDQMEELFASPEMIIRVRELEEQSTIILDNESKDRALVGDVISTVALAGQISREFTVSDHGIDMEIEFKDDNHEATGKKLYLQLKSGDSYLRQRKRDGIEVFTIKDERHVRYWMAQRFPVLLVIRDSKGVIRWMEIRDWLKQKSENGRQPVKQIDFKGERFDVMSVRRWREKML